MRHTRFKTLSLALALSLLSAGAMAGTSTGTSQVTATVVSDCQISTQNLTFGSIDGLVASFDSSIGQVGVLCNNQTPFSIVMDNGLNFGANTAYSADKAMVSPSTGHALAYRLFQDNAYSVAWDSGNPLTGVGTGNPEQFFVYGEAEDVIHAPTATDYADTINFTLTY
ncbi:MAG: spore coat protein U domain-containing protein [Xanthomonadaceae bacterium]|nr:spore coat protein U domain-containing protein [Xanthomonadaceae bacterium]